MRRTISTASVKIVILTRSKLIWPISSLKKHQNVQKTRFWQKAAGVNGLNKSGLHNESLIIPL